MVLCVIAWTLKFLDDYLSFDNFHGMNILICFY